ncbi:3'-5' exonuclease [Gluconobacter sp. R75690]|uniref:3'-5' exonuclease n=1 Tax=unclassified Gluconobacter TaxID=2644261 RepID=UPI00188CFC2A|nr:MULTISPECIES: 3'-5' exonuclease [unclassified Gluconobacter]MBF0850471.1 3'-5' exonuclease [Gluconobacter sp. R75690]MBF0879163.1 3'-5' exonuclease [Gluconobacter sp. R75828]
MSILFFDTETTGFAKPGLPTGHEDQPHCMQLAAILTDDHGQEEACVNVIIRPDGWTVPERAAAVHGITTEKAARYGIREQVAAVLFYDLTCRADLLVAHNIQFDRQIVATMYARAKRSEWKLPEAQFCTMEAAAPLVNLPPTPRMRAAGIIKPKAPKLEECIQHFYGETLEGAHDALVDVRACARIYFEMKRMGEAA